MTNPRMRIRTPSRLHFGLLGWGPQATSSVRRRRLDDRLAGDRALGRARVVVAHRGPATRRGSSSSSIIFEGKMREAGMTLPPAHIRVERAPPEHVGLGVGTQLCLAVARAVFQLAGLSGRIGRRARAMDGARPPLGNRPARFRAWRADRRWGKKKRGRHPSTRGPPAVSGGLVDPDRAAAGRERPAWARREPGLRRPAAHHTGRDRLALPPGPPRDPARGPRARSGGFWRGAG